MEKGEKKEKEGKKVPNNFAHFQFFATNLHKLKTSLFTSAYNCASIEDTTVAFAVTITMKQCWRRRKIFFR